MQQKIIKKYSSAGLSIIRTEQGNIAVINKKGRPLCFFYGEHAIEEADEYIIKCINE